MNMALSSALSSSAICCSMELFMMIICAFSSSTTFFSSAVNRFPVCMAASSTLATYNTGLSVSKKRSATADLSSLPRSSSRIFFPFSSCCLHRFNISYSAFTFGSAVRNSFSVRENFLSTLSRSLSWSSVSMISLSDMGSIAPSSRRIFSSSKQRITCTMASTSRILARNLFPRPSPLLAPFTKPAMSTISIWVGTIRLGFTSSASLSNLESGTSTSPILGSIVQKR